jgi:hypothetical protein
MDAWLTQAQQTSKSLAPEVQLVLAELQLRLGLLDFEGIRQLTQSWELDTDPCRAAN